METPAPRRSTLARAACRALMALTTVVLGAGCSKTVTYTYVDVHVMVDPQTIRPAQLATVVSCEFQVLGAEMTDGFTIRCPENNVRYDVGTFNWTSNASSGSLQFRVRMYAVNRVIVGEATSEPIPVSPGKRLKADVLVIGILPTTGADGGDDMAPADAAGIDTAADSAITTDGSVETTTDGPSSDTGGGDQAPDAGTSDAAPADVAADAGTPDAAPDVAADQVGDSAADGPVDTGPG